MNKTIGIVFIALLAGCGNPPISSSGPFDLGWTHGNSLEFDERHRTYSVYVPSNSEVQGLVVVLHGAGQTVEHMISELAAEPAAEEHGLLIVVPAGVDNGWNDEDPPGDGLADDVGFIDSLVDEVTIRHPGLQSDHIFAHGFSNGGGLATRLACESTQIRGVGVVGNYYMPFFEGCPRPMGDPIPGWFGAGVDDELVTVGSVRQGMASYVADLTDCPNSEPLQPVEAADVPNDVICKQSPGCDLARLCEYDNRGHEMLPGSLSAAWNFLSAAIEGSVD